MHSKVWFGLAVALLAAVAIAPPAAANGTGDVLLARSPHGRKLVLGDVAAGSVIAVVWQKGNHSYLRWSADGGLTFAPHQKLRSGHPAKDPRVAVCGDVIWAVSQWPTTNGLKVGVDWVDVTGGTSGHYAVGYGYNADVACMDGAVAVTWVHGDAMLAIIDDRCTSSCTPDFVADLGPVEASRNTSGPVIAATDDGFAVAYVGPDWTGLTVQHSSVVSGVGGLTVTPGSPLAMMSDKSVSNAFIGADGSRVVVAYSRSGRTDMRISEDGGVSFGPRIIVVDPPSWIGSGPDSVDVLAGRIAVGVTEGSGDPPAIEDFGKATENDGQPWTKTAGHSGGYQIGALTANSLVEAWDTHFYADPVYGHVKQEIWFHATALN